jgi:hypothetical protein
MDILFQSTGILRFFFQWRLPCTDSPVTVHFFYSFVFHPYHVSFRSPHLVFFSPLSILLLVYPRILNINQHPHGRYPRLVAALHIRSRG